MFNIILIVAVMMMQTPFNSGETAEESQSQTEATSGHSGRRGHPAGGS